MDTMPAHPTPAPGRYRTLDEIATRLGVSRSYAANLLSRRGIKSVRVYPAAKVDPIELSGRGTRTDLRGTVVRANGHVTPT